MYYKPEKKVKERILTVRVSADLVESIDKVAKKLGVTRSKLIKTAMEKVLEELSKESSDDIARATALMAQGKHIKHSPEEWKKIERKLEGSVPP
jgi:predicted transcriptional regulator